MKGLFVFSACFFGTLALSAAQEGASTGDEGCPCIDSSEILRKISDCTRPGDIPGVLVDDACYPVTYGANTCAPYDMDVDPLCQGPDPPNYCASAFCYVNATKCHMSDQKYYKSGFGFKLINKITNLDLSCAEDTLYYSYRTCGSSEDDWHIFQTTNILKGRRLVGVVPAVTDGDHFKSDPESGETFPFDSPYAYDRSIPWEGWVIDYIKKLVEYSDIAEVEFKVRSGGSRQNEKYQNDEWTQAVTDIEAGVADFGAGIFWVTTERLELTPFSVPIYADPISIWIPQPELDQGTLRENVGKLLKPFTPDLWFFLIGSIVVFAVLRVMFSKEKYKLKVERSASRVDRMKAFAPRMAKSLFTSFLEFFGGSIDFSDDKGGPQMVLNVGFAIVIFVAVASYTANLAAFLTISNAQTYISSIEGAMAQNAAICTFKSLELDLMALYQNANWVFVDWDVFEKYDEGVCSIIVGGTLEVFANRHLQDGYCLRDLRRVETPVMEKPVSLPVAKDLVGGISYWIEKAASEGLTIESIAHNEAPVCSLELQTESGGDEDDLIPLTPTNMVLPFLFFAISAVVAGILHSREAIKKRRQKSGLDETERINGDMESNRSSQNLKSVSMVGLISDSSSGSELEEIANQLEQVQRLVHRIHSEATKEG